jgi:uncharacterized membrane protein YkvA (DUF1232 family)
MTQQGQSPDVKRMAGFLGEIAAHVRLVWRLLNDPDVPVWLKLIPPLAILYLISPVDILPDPILGLGQLDDAAVLLLGLKLFVEMSPRNIVQRHRDELAGSTPPVPEGDVVDADYRVVDDE